MHRIWNFVSILKMMYDGCYVEDFSINHFKF